MSIQQILDKILELTFKSQSDYHTIFDGNAGPH